MRLIRPHILVTLISMSLSMIPLCAGQPTDDDLMAVLEGLCNADYRPYYVESRITYPGSDSYPLPGEIGPRGYVGEYFLDLDRYGYRIKDRFGGYGGGEDSGPAGEGAERRKSHHWFWDGAVACGRVERFDIWDGFRCDPSVLVTIDPGATASRYASRTGGWRLSYASGRFMHGYNAAADMTIADALGRCRSELRVERDALDHEGRRAIAIRGGQGAACYEAFLSPAAPHRLLGSSWIEDRPDGRTEHRFSTLASRAVEGVEFPTHGRILIVRREPGDEQRIGEIEVQLLKVQFNPDFEALGAFELRIPAGAEVGKAADRRTYLMREGRLVPALRRDGMWVPADG